MEPREPADEPRREHRRRPRGRRPQLHHARRRCCSSAAGTGFDAARRGASSGSTTCPRAGSSPPSAFALRNLLEAYLPPETATRRNPFREWVGARLRVDAYGWAAGGDPVAAARMAWHDARRQPHRERRLRRDVHGRGPRRLARRLEPGRVRRSRPLGRPAAEPARRGDPHGARPRGRVGGRRRRALRALRRPPRRARDQQHGARRRRALHGSTTSRRRSAPSSRAAGTPTRTAPPSARSSAPSRRSRSAGRRRSTAGSRARCRASTGSRSTSSSPAPAQSREQTIESAVRPARPAADRPADGRAARAGAARRRSTTAQDPGCARRPGRLAGVARAARRPGARTPARGSAYDGAAYDLPVARLDAELLRLRARLALGRRCSTTTRRGRFTPDRLLDEARARVRRLRRASSSGTPTR